MLTKRQNTAVSPFLSSKPLDSEHVSPPLGHLFPYRLSPPHSMTHDVFLPSFYQVVFAEKLSWAIGDLVYAKMHK